MISPNDESAIQDLSRELNISLNPSRLRRVPVITTNQVYLYDSRFVFKKYKNEMGFNSESSIYHNRDIYDFDIPGYIGHYTDLNGHFWIVLEFIPSINAIQFIDEDKNHAKYLIDCTTKAIIDFETKALNNDHLGIVKWSMERSLSPLLQDIASNLSIEIADSLRYALQLGDYSISRFEYIPCFDAFLNNTLVIKRGGKYSLIFCDFDKAYRKVPIGEQLSHFFIHHQFNDYLERAIHTYSEAYMCDSLEIRKTLDITRFARALSGIRDYKFWSDSVSADSSRRKFAVDLINSTRSCFHSVSQELGLSKSIRDDVFSLCNKLKEIVN